MAIAFVDNGRVTTLGFGHRSREDTRAPDADTTFEIGSVSKTLAGVLLADAANRGEVALDAPANGYLPQGFALPMRDGSAITLRELATHRSGLPFFPSNFIRLDPVTHRTRYTLDHLREYLGSAVLDPLPPHGYRYGNVSTAMIAIALSEQTHLGWSEILDARLFTPLSMRRSGYVDRDNAHIDDNFFVGHDEDGTAAIARTDTSPLGPCCAVRSTAGDMSRFMLAALDPRSPLEAAFRLAAVPIAAQTPEGEARSLAWTVLSREGLIHKDGQVAGYRSIMAIHPRTQRGVFVVVNSEQADIWKLAHGLIDLLIQPQPNVDEAAHRENVVNALPDNATRSDATFDDSIRLEGWSAPSTARAGESVQVKLYFRVLARVPRDWRVFIHGDVRDPAKAKRIHSDHFPGGDRDSTVAWNVGELVEDVVTLEIPADFRPEAFDVWLGFYRFQSRMRALSSTTEVRNDKALGPTIRVAH